MNQRRILRPITVWKRGKRFWEKFRRGIMTSWYCGDLFESVLSVRSPDGKISDKAAYRQIQYRPFRDPEGSDNQRDSDNPRMFALNDSPAKYLQNTAGRVSLQKP